MSERRTRSIDGFTMIELLVVIGIIVLAAAIAFPAIGRYLRVYQIRGASQQVAGEIQTARLKAIGRNVNHGVLFVVLSPTTYRWVLEDAVPLTGTPLPYDPAPPVSGPVQSLPTGVTFDPNPPDRTDVPTGAANSCTFRFTRLGTWEGPPTAGVRVPLPACATNLIRNDTAGGGGRVTVLQARTGLRANIVVASGGRVQVHRGW